MSEKVVVVTGAGGDIGSALCAVFNKSYYSVVALDRHSTAPKTMHGLSSVTYQSLDLRNYANDEGYRVAKRDELLKKIPTSLERLVLINNAATQIVTSIQSLSVAACNESFSVNVMAALLLISDLSRLLAESKGTVINISSIHATQTKRYFSLYAASKAALESVTRSTALELAPLGVKVFGFAPAAIATPMLKAGFLGKEKEFEALANYHPAHQLGSPTDFARLVEKLVELEDPFLNGSTIYYDGAISAVLSDPAS